MLILGSVTFLVVVLALGALLFEAMGVGGVYLVVAGIIGLYIARGYINAAERANSVEITPEQFPDVSERIDRYAELFELDDVPTAYMAQSGGTLNAFASKHNRTNFIRINSDIFEVGSFGLGPRERDTASLDFIIAHELGHVAASHTTYWYTFISGYVSYIPFVGHALSRAKEFTADNYGYHAAPDGVSGIVLLSGGKYLYPDVDPQQFVDRARSDRGVFVFLYNALSSHPIITKRLEALKDRSRPGRLF
jgi:Zn-dependent protease with chaperone function